MKPSRWKKSFKAEKSIIYRALLRGAFFLVHSDTSCATRATRVPPGFFAVPPGNHSDTKGVGACATRATHLEQVSKIRRAGKKKVVACSACLLLCFLLLF